MHMIASWADSAGTIGAALADLLRALAALARARTSAEAPGRTGRSPLPSSFRAKRIRAISGSIGLARWQAGASRKRAKQVGQKRLLRRRVARTSCTGDHKAQIADTESGCKNNTLRTAWHCGNDSARTRGAMWFADLQAKRSCCQCTHTRRRALAQIHRRAHQRNHRTCFARRATTHNNGKWPVSSRCNSADMLGKRPDSAGVH